MRPPRRALASLLALVALLGVLVGLDTSPAAAASISFTVNSTADASDASAGNGTCATGASACTLRAAIEEINAGSSANTYTIGFSVSGTVQVGAADLPPLIRSTTIDGSTAPGYSVATGPAFTVRCESQDSSVSDYGISFAATNSTLRGLRLVNCSTAVTTSSGATNLTVAGNQIGNDGASFSAANAVTSGVSINGSGSVVGGATAADRNVISGEKAVGVSLGSSAGNSKVQGNYLGTDKTGSAGIKNPNGSASGTASAALQSSATGAVITGNVVSGNPGLGVSVGGGSATLQGNLIGTDATGAAGIGNGLSGVMVWPGATATIGGTGPGEGNVVAYYVAPTANTTAPLIEIYGATATLLGNKIGSNAAGTAALCTANALVTTGVWVLPQNNGTAANVTIGGNAAGAGNLISGCKDNITVDRFSSQTTGGSNVTIQGNRIGTNAAGTAALLTAASSDANNAGITVGLDQKVTIGGTAAGAGNLISGNSTGIEVHENRSGVTVQGNLIGTDAAGAASVPNRHDGVDVIGSSPPPAQGSAAPILIGGSTAGSRNVISGNGSYGLLVATAGTIQGNSIGINAAGTAAVPNQGTYGALLNNKDIVFGGTGAGEGNVVSGQANVGLGVASSIQVPAIYGNKIGTNPAGTAAIPNNGTGISLGSGVTGSVGGTGAGQANLVAFNGRAGVNVGGSSAVDIRGNLVHSNTWLNIDLYQHGEASSAGNHDQINPTLTAAVAGPSDTSVAGTVTSDRTGTILVDVYGGSTCQPSFGTGEAKAHLGTISVPYPTAGVATAFSGTVAKSTVGSVITATSTISGNGTSQLSACNPYSDIEITAKDNYARAPIGADVGTEFTVKNAGPTPVTNLAVQVGIPSGDYSAADGGTVDTPSAGTVDAGTSVWTIPGLAPGASAKVCVRGDIVKSGYSFEVAPGLPITIPVFWSPDVGLKSGAVDPYIGNNRGSGFTEVGTAAVGASVCPLPTLSIDDASLVRPASGTSPMVFTVRLSAAQTRPVTVHWATANGKAVAVEDYVAGSGDLTFAAGETSKTFAVAVVGNQSDEPDKAFTVTLSSPKHALVADGSASGTVKANHLLQGCPSGSSSNQRFVCHLYFDALDRAPESGGFTYWVGKLNRGTPRSTMASSYLTQSESLRKVSDRAYVLYLGRHGTSAELTGWANKLKAKSATTQDIRIAVLASAEYYAHTGGTNDKYVKQMFLDVFRRNVDASGLSYWTGQLAAGKTRTNVATRFMAEPEGKRKIVGDIYLRFLRREPTTAEASSWVSKLAAGKTEVDVGIGLVASTEYYNRPQN